MNTLCRGLAPCFTIDDKNFVGRAAAVAPEYRSESNYHHEYDDENKINRHDILDYG
jgi:hypothetical protein